MEIILWIIIGILFFPAIIGFKNLWDLLEENIKRLFNKLFKQ